MNKSFYTKRDWYNFTAVSNNAATVAKVRIGRNTTQFFLNMSLLSTMTTSTKMITQFGMKIIQYNPD